VKHDTTSLGLFLEWNTSQLGMTSAQGALLASTLAKILEGVVTATPKIKVREIDCMSALTLEHICDLNQRVRIDPVERCVHDIVAERVADHPTKKALMAWDGVLTYDQLDVAASRLAARLVRTGLVGRDAMVPLCFDKSVCLSFTSFSRSLPLRKP